MMRFHDIRYLVREGFRNSWQNRFMALASVGVLICCLLLTGFAYLTFVNIDSLFRNAYEQNVVAVYLDTALDEAAVEEIGNQLKTNDNVAKVDFISKQEYLDRFKEEMGEAAIEGLEEDNPLQDTYIVSFKDLERFDVTIDRIERMEGVEDVSYDGDLAKTLTRVRGLVLGIGGAIIVVLLAVSLFIISNTIKLTVYNRRLEIYIMKSVGATDGFVRFPFVVEGVILGFVAGTVGFALLWLLYSQLVKSFAGGILGNMVPFAEVWAALLIGFMVGGILVGVGGSAISMSRYLKQEGSLRV
jgi:cell division transport system permease protein